MFDITTILFLIALVISVGAQIAVKSAFGRYSKVPTGRGLTGAEAARMILDRNGLTNIVIEHIGGSLTDHFDPTANVIRLSDEVYNSPTVAAVGVAAHEAGHAVQYAVGYYPIKVRSAIIPMTQIGSKLTTPLVILGLFLTSYFPSAGFALVDIGILLFCAVVFFQAVTLPVEFNASRRALATLRDGYILEGSELNGAKKVLTAAAMTYVAALVSALLSLVRLLLIRGRRR